jgi:hypothetical protein
MVIYRDIDLRNSGYDPIAPITRDMPGIGRLQRVARDNDIALSGIVAYRIGSDMWCIYRRPGNWPGYTSEPMLR